MWKIILEVSRRDFEKTFEALSISIPEKGESAYRAQIPSIIAELQEKSSAYFEDSLSSQLRSYK